MNAMQYLISVLLHISLLSSIQPVQGEYADVTQVKTSGSAESYTFHVTLNSPDKGCSQYADWWEVVSEDGKLVYRRILLHSHVNEQPFTRSGGSVDIGEDEVVWIRAHMNNSGYGGMAMKGSVREGFTQTEWPDNLGVGLEKVAPLPKGCSF